MAKERAIDAAREYKERFREDIRNRNQPEPLAGLRQLPNQRYIYLRLNVGETPKEQQKSVFNYLKQWHKQNGDLPACVHDQGWLLTLPGGDSFCDFCVARGAALVTETDEEMIPFVERGVELFLEFASSAGRSTGTIQNESIFLCNDGRRVSLAECAYRPLTDEDFARPRRKSKRQ